MALHCHLRPAADSYQEVTEWVREDEFGNIVARGVVGQDDPYEEPPEEEEQEEQEQGPRPTQQADWVTTNRYPIIEENPQR